MDGRVTMADVAREADVSLMTVSRVVNDKGEISPSTRQRVLEVIERLGYRPSAIARGLATNRTGTLGLVVPDIANPFFSDIARGVEEEAYAAGYNVFLCSTYEDPERETDVLQSLEEQRIDGLVLCSSRLDDKTLRRMLAGFPAIVLTNRWLDGYGAGVIRVDSELGGRLATNFLLDAGHTAVGFLTGPPTSVDGRLRVNGYHAALEAAGKPRSAALERPCPSNVDGGREAAREFLASQPGLTALLCYNDLVAIGALFACVDLGLRVPSDLAVVGFDDIALAAWVSPPLTTCGSPRFELGVKAMQMLLDRIDGGTGEGQEILVQPELVVRSSAP
jgi:LacI family transcriptional regulator